VSIMALMFSNLASWGTSQPELKMKLEMTLELEPEMKPEMVMYLYSCFLTNLVRNLGDTYGVGVVESSLEVA